MDPHNGILHCFKSMGGASRDAGLASVSACGTSELLSEVSWFLGNPDSP